MNESEAFTGIGYLDDLEDEDLATKMPRIKCQQCGSKDVVQTLDGTWLCRGCGHSWRE